MLRTIAIGLACWVGCTNEGAPVVAATDTGCTTCHVLHDQDGIATSAPKETQDCDACHKLTPTSSKDAASLVDLHHHLLGDRRDDRDAVVEPSEQCEDCHAFGTR